MGKNSLAFSLSLLGYANECTTHETTLAAAAQLRVNTEETHGLTPR